MRYVPNTKAKQGKSRKETKLSKPSPKNKRSKPSPKNRLSKPSPKDKLSKPSPKNKLSKPSPKDRLSKPSPKDRLSKPSPKNKLSKPSPKDRLSKPSPKNKLSKPSPKDRLSKPSPKDRLSKFSPKNKLSKPFRKTKLPSSDFAPADMTDDVAEEFEQTKKWYEGFGEGDEQTDCEVKFADIDKFRKEAKSILESAVAVNSHAPPKSISMSDFLWMKTVMAKGTKTDKIAAYTVLIQDSPLYNLNILNNIIGLIKVAKKEWTMAAEALQELFLNDLLPPRRKLILFSRRPINKLQELSGGIESKKKNILLYWFFENQLKLAFRDFVVALNQIAHDSVDANKEKAITIMYKLLENSPEQEDVLLSNIVNKMGDPSHKVGSKVIYILTKLLQTHPNMRAVVMEEVEKLIFRPNISKKAQYYSVCFLTQFCLTNSDSDLARKLISIYLSIFKACIKTGDVDSRLMGALLTGVNRAYPFAKEDMGSLKEQIDTIYKVVHIAKPSVSIQALSLLFLMSNQSSSISDRFFSVLYKKISEPKLFASTHHAMFLSLIFKAMKKDKCSERVCAFIKRLLQVSTYLTAPLACGILFIISQVVFSGRKKNILNLEQKSVISLKIKPSCNEVDDDGSDDGYEHYDDVHLESDVEGKAEAEVKSSIPTPVVVNCERFSNNEYGIGEVKSDDHKVWRNPYISVDDRKFDVTEYNPYHRNPLYAGGDKIALTELLKLANYYHPSVSLFATKILNGEKISYGGDPLQDFALIRFLDKFSFKNPKVMKTDIEQKETFSKFGKRKLYSKKTMIRLKLNTEEYLKKHETIIPVDEKFIYSYLKKKKPVGSVKKEEDASDVDSVASSEFDDMISKITGMETKDDIDFLNEVGQLPKKSKGEVTEKKKEEVESGGEEDVFSDEFSVEEFEGDELDDDTDDLLEGSELDESEIPDALKNLDLPKKRKSDRRRKDSSFKNKLLASAEEFSEMIEQNDYRGGGSEAVSNRDNAGLKQLKWEAERDRTFRSNYRRSKNVKRFKRSGKSPKQGGKRRRT